MRSLGLSCHCTADVEFVLLLFIDLLLILNYCLVYSCLLLQKKALLYKKILFFEEGKCNMCGVYLFHILFT